MIFALQSVKECSHSKLHTQFDPVSKWTPHCRMLLVAFPFDTLRLKRVAEEYSVRFARLPSTVQSTSMLAMMWQPSPDENRVQQGAVLDAGGGTNHTPILSDGLKNGLGALLQ